MKPTPWQRFKSSVSKSLGLVETSASTLDYTMKTLELKAFILRASVISDALSDEKTKNTLCSVVVSEDDSENVRTFMESMRLNNQSSNVSTQSTNVVTQPNASNLTRRN